MNNTIRTMTDQQRASAKSYLENIRYIGLKSDVRAVVRSIEKQFVETGWISRKQLDVLRRCALATNISNPMGGFKQGPCYGRNAPAGRR